MVKMVGGAEWDPEALLRLITFKCNCSHTSRNIVKIQIFGKQ